MQSEVRRLAVSLGLGVACTVLAAAGNLEPRYTLQDGTVTNSGLVVRKSGQSVADISPSWGALKLLFGVGAWVAFAYALEKSYEYEPVVEQANRVLQAQYDAQLEQNAITYEAERQALAPVAVAAAEKAAERRVVELAVKGEVGLPQAQFIAQPEQPKQHLQDFSRLFGENPKTALVIGVPGAGKGMFVSNAIRALKATHPDVWVLGVDPKNDPKETGYWQQGFDQVLRFNQEKLNGEALLTYIERIVEQFKGKAGPRLLVFDELKICCKRMKNADNKRFKEVIDYFVFLASSGDSQKIFFWGIGQSANAEDYGINGGDRGVFKPVAIASKTDIAASKQLLGTKYAPTDAPESVINMMNESPVGRALYWYPDGQWYPMPELHNYSGYNRDKRAAV